MASLGNVFGRPRGPSPASWFTKLFGFVETELSVGVNTDRVRSKVEFSRNADGVYILRCPHNGNEFLIGEFTLSSVQELREQLGGVGGTGADIGLVFSQMIGDVKLLHCDPANAGAVFQAASQFNCLEMTHPSVTPQDGIENYLLDRTQGPACAMACAAGTFYRNYLVPVALVSNIDAHHVPSHSSTSSLSPPRVVPGQEGSWQINTMVDIETILHNHEKNYWKMMNGYLLPVHEDSLEKLNKSIHFTAIEERSLLVSSLRVGIQSNTQVTSAVTSEGSTQHCVTQVYVSAVPVGYDQKTPIISSAGVSREDQWMPLAKVVLEGAYEATLAVAALQAKQSGKRVKCYLTKVGGGVFRNKTQWICSAIQKALDAHKHSNIDVILVHFAHLERDYAQLYKNDC